MWPFYVLSLSPSKRNKTSKTGDRCNQYKQPTANGSAVTVSFESLRVLSVMEKEPSQLLQGHFEYLMMVAVIGGLLDRHG